jgi:hypothetical protein
VLGAAVALDAVLGRAARHGKRREPGYERPADAVVARVD